MRFSGGRRYSGQNRRMRVAYKHDPAIGITVNLIRSWKRGEIAEPVMSASSGPKAYLRNDIWSIFDTYPDIARVLMVRGEYLRSIPFLLMVSESGQVVDMAGKAVVVKR